LMQKDVRVTLSGEPEPVGFTDPEQMLFIFRLCSEMLLGQRNNPICRGDTWKNSLQMSGQ